MGKSPVNWSVGVCLVDDLEQMFYNLNHREERGQSR